MPKTVWNRLEPYRRDASTYTYPAPRQPQHFVVTHSQLPRLELPIHNGRGLRRSLPEHPFRTGSPATPQQSRTLQRHHTRNPMIMKQTTVNISPKHTKRIPSHHARAFPPQSVSLDGNHPARMVQIHGRPYCYRKPLFNRQVPRAAQLPAS